MRVVDPWWAAHMGAPHRPGPSLALFALFAAVWIYFASGLPSSQTLLAYQPPLPTNVRGYDGDAGPDLRPRAPGRSCPTTNSRRWSSTPSSRPRTRASSRTTASTSRARSRRCSITPSTIVTGRGRVPGGSTITQQVAKYLLQGFQLQCRAQGARGDPRLPARIDADQAADPRDLPQFDLPRPQRLRRPGRRRAPISTRTSTSSPCPKRPISRSCRARPPITILSARRRRRSTDALMCSARCTATATSPRSSGRAAAARRSAPSATAAARSSASRAAISWRKSAAS